MADECFRECEQPSEFTCPQQPVTPKLLGLCLQGHLGPTLSSLYELIIYLFTPLNVKWDLLSLPVLPLYFIHGRIGFRDWRVFHWPIASQTSPSLRIPFFPTCAAIKFFSHASAFHSSVHLPFCHRQIVRTQAVTHPTHSNSSARRITSVSTQINLGFICLSNGFRALVS